jgi:hypothetical protein
LIDYCFTLHSKTFHSYGDAIVTDEGLQNLLFKPVLGAQGL